MVAEQHDWYPSEELTPFARQPSDSRYGTKEHQEAERLRNKAFSRWRAVAWKLVEIEPATPAGFLALMEHVQETEEYIQEWQWPDNRKYTWEGEHHRVCLKLRVPAKITEVMDAAFGMKDQAATAPKRSSYFFGSPKHIPRSAARAGTPELRIDLDVGLTRRPVKGPANADQAEGRTLRGASYGR